MTQHLTPADYLKKILTARVYDVAVESALEPAKSLSRRLHNKVLLKREDQQPVFSFKLRGAYNKMAHLTPEQLKKGVICASAGNHAQGVALSARKLGIRAVIVMPTTTPQVKIDAVKGFGGEVVLHGDSYSDAHAHALQLQADGPDKPLLDVWFANEQTGYVVGVFNLILRTDDGGQSWTPMQDRTDNPQGLHLNAIASTGDGLYIAGEQGLLRKWDTASQRFAALQTPYQGSFFGVLGKPGEVLVYGLRGNVLRNIDGGQSWTALDSGLHVSLTAGLIDAQGNYRLFTQAGQMLVSQGSGAQLKLMTQPAPIPVAGATQSASGALVVAGSRGARTLSILEP